VDEEAGYPAYVVSAEEILWGTSLVALTMVVHGTGMILTLRASRSFSERFKDGPPTLVGWGTFVLASWTIASVHCADVMVWAAFFALVGGMPNLGTAYHHALLEYTTIGSGLAVPLDWRVLEGLTAIAGVLTFAWSTSVLLTLERKVQGWRSLVLRRRREERRHGSRPAASRRAGDPG
jgi:hypothetical protein